MTSPAEPTDPGRTNQQPDQAWDPAYPSSSAYPYAYPYGYGYGYGHGYGHGYQAQYQAQQGGPATYQSYPNYYGTPYGQQYYPYGGYPPPPPPGAPKRSRRRGWAGLGVAAVAAATVVGVALATGGTQAVNGTALALPNSSTGSSGGSSSGGSSSGGSSGGGSTVPGGGSLPGNGHFPFPGNGPSRGSAQGTATDAQQVGVVDIVSEQQYNQAAAAGTGVVLTSDGRILTNNHVIDGATAIRVTVVSTGKTYTAKVVGTAPTKDIAVLQLQNASGLQTADLGDSDTVSVGDAVTGVGNAGGTGGTPSAASGKVTALNKTITASDEGGGNAETLHGVIVTDAPIQSGDSGGPLYNSDNKVIGIDTAASTSGRSVGFAIPINAALAVVAEIDKGVETSSIHIGYPGFLGISVGRTGTSTSGALVAGVLNGGPADKAGIEAGDLITRIDSTTITNATQLRSAVSSHEPGSKVSVTYLDPNTGSHTATVTLATGPAD